MTYLCRSRNEHSLHSPFVFDLYTQIIRRDNAEESAFHPIRLLQKSLYRNNHMLTITDFGAGSRVSSSCRRPIRDIARYSEKPARFGRLLYRLIGRYQKPIVFDLGTSLGITTLYEALAAPDGHIITFEGCPETAAVAQRNFNEMNCQNIKLKVGNLDVTLVEEVETASRIDVAFFDANHRYEPTIRYFYTCLPKIHNDTCFVFDDIHWSSEMENAWETIKRHPAVTISIDLFYIGLVFFRQQQPKQNFILRF